MIQVTCKTIFGVRRNIKQCLDKVFICILFNMPHIRYMSNMQATLIRKSQNIDFFFQHSIRVLALSSLITILLIIILAFLFLPFTCLSTSFHLSFGLPNCLNVFPFSIHNICFLVKEGVANLIISFPLEAFFCPQKL